jgi:hypothetical protein
LQDRARRLEVVPIRRSHDYGVEILPFQHFSVVGVAVRHSVLGTHFVNLVLLNRTDGHDLCQRMSGVNLDVETPHRSQTDNPDSDSIHG